MGGMVTVFDPQGNRGEIPHDQLPAFVKAGGMPAITMKDPDGNEGYVPANRYLDAFRAGAKVVPFESQEVKHPGFWSSMVDDLKAMPGKIYDAVTAYDPMTDPNLSEHQKMQIVDQRAAQMDADAAARKAKGYGTFYSEIQAPAEEMVGLNVQGAEKSAEEGDPGGVLGHMYSTPAAMAITEGIARGGAGLSDRLASGLSELPDNTASRVLKTAKMTAKDVAEDIPVVRKITKLKNNWNATAPKPATPQAELDATGENKPFAGGTDEWTPPKKRSLAELDATGENKPFAGGMDELTAKPAAAVTPAPKPRTLADLQPEAIAQTQAQAAAPEPTPKPAAKPKATPKPKAAPVTPSGDPILDALRQKAAAIHAAGGPEAFEHTGETAAPSATAPAEDDLIGQLLKSLEPENLARFKARKLATQ
jgi:hypothetical protein